MGVMTHSWESRLIHMTHDLFTQTHTYLYLTFKGIEFTCLYMHTQMDTYPRTDTPPLHTRMHAYLAFQGIEFVHLKPQSECERQNVYIHIYTCTSRSRASSSRIGICTQMDTFTKTETRSIYKHTYTESYTYTPRSRASSSRIGICTQMDAFTKTETNCIYKYKRIPHGIRILRVQGHRVGAFKKKIRMRKVVLTHIYIYTYTCIHIYLHIYTYILTHIYIYTYTYIHMYTYLVFRGTECAHLKNPQSAKGST